jgi:photosystem I P700 chlorophyll a apoprotein A2
LFLGFHTLLIYVHNDTVLAFGIPSKQISIEPTWVQILQGGSGKITPIAISTYSSWANLPVSSSILYVGPGDLLSHHGISLGLHTTQLIFTKSVLDASGSSLLPDKYNIGYGYSCDGPGRGGTCDISAWDGIYLGSFWVLNLGGWITFYYHWKHLTIWQGSPSLFDEGSTYLNGYFRDYLWFNSGPLIKGYDSISTTDLSVAAWAFLASHFAWAVGFMYLISWRGYWQELIDSIIYMHLQSPYLYSYNFTNGLTPTALSIVQARLVGLSHFALGYLSTYSPFIFGSTS